MLILPPIRRFRHAKKPTPIAPVGPLTLVAASVDESPSVTLQFDRAMDVSTMDVTTIVVADGDLGFSYVGFGTPMLLDPMTVQVQLNGTDEDDDPGVFLTVGAGNGIVAVGDGGTWGGVEALGLPWP